MSMMGKGYPKAGHEMMFEDDTEEMKKEKGKKIGQKKKMAKKKKGRAGKKC